MRTQAMVLAFYLLDALLMAAYAVQGYAPKRDAAGKPYNGRFFSAFDAAHARQYDLALAEWEERKNSDLAFAVIKQLRQVNERRRPIALANSIRQAKHRFEARMRNH